MKSTIHKYQKNNKKVMSKNSILKIATTLVFILAIMSCSPKDGAVGPAGPAGPTGANGTNSNVNVFSSPWATRTFTGSGTNWTTTYAMPQINEQTLQSGLILTFKKTDLGETIQVTNTITPYFFIFYFLGNVQIGASSNQTGMYRNIIIPSQDCSTCRNTNSDYSIMSYKEICTKFNILE